MASISAKIFEVFRNLKSDAMPRPPRPPSTLEENPDESYAETDEPEHIFNEYNEQEQTNNEQSFRNDNEKPKKSFFKPHKKAGFGFPKGKDKKNSYSTINTQATGPVTVISNSRGVHYGDEVVYYVGAAATNQKKHTFSEENIEKCNLIQILMEVQVKPDEEYIDYVSKNLGKEWPSFFRRLGFTRGRIETVEIDEGRNGIAEVRYKLLLDWRDNNDNATLGRLSTLLWEEGERQVVKEMAIIYNKNQN